jgi:UDP-4-amino-4,6-dideoxy-N-acetyl-beta-L-altrosamine transaminase
MISYSRQSISRSDISAVKKILKSEYLTQGPAVPKFEKEVASYCNSSFAVAVNSATSALHIACLALDVGPGDYVWTSPNSFVASANCALYCGARIDFVDIDPKTYNISVVKLSEKLELAKKANKLPKLVIPVHFAGQSCDMESIHKLSIEYGFKVIEDASHAISGYYQNELIGNCKYSDITVFSFHPVKVITTGEGGMAITNDENIYKKLLMLRTHGITRDKQLFKYKDPDEIWNYQQLSLGFNFRMTDFQAALGISQLKKINKFAFQRQKIAERYNAQLEKLDVIIPFQSNNGKSSYHLYPIRVNSAKRNKIYQSMLDRGIGVNIHYIPIHLQPYYKNFGFKEGDFLESEKFFAEEISLPIFPDLKVKKQNFIVKILKELL